MVSIARVRTTWTGFNGAPGYTNLFFRDFGGEPVNGNDITAEAAAAAAGRVRSFFSELAPVFPNDVVLTVDSVVDIIESADGKLIDSYTIPAPAVVNGTQTGTFSSVTGAVVGWQTGAIRNSRRIRGRTFLVPAAGLAFNASGRLDPGTQAQIQTAANKLVATNLTPDLGVWARPTTKGATDGQWAVATGARVPDLPAILRSRRD